MKEMKEILGTCKQCGRLEEVTPGSILLKCWRCAMAAADKVAIKEKQESNSWDWPEIIRRVRRAEKITQGTLAYHLKMSPSLLTLVKKNKKPIPELAFRIFKEKFSKFLVENETL